MHKTTWSSPSTLAAVPREALLPLGFTPAAGGYQRDTLRLDLGPDWWCFTQLELGAKSASGPDAAVAETLGPPGPWKWVDSGGTGRRVLSLPARIFSEDHDARSTGSGRAGAWDQDGTESVLEEVLRWVQATADGQVPHGWRAPERAVVESWFSREELTVVVGGLLCQGELICEPDRLTLRFPVLTAVPVDLPPPRQAWLREVLEETNNRWHLVRCGLAQDADAGSRAAIAEVDLTGAPPAVNETLFVTSLEALRGAVQWLGEPADWLADVTVMSELLAVCPKQEPTKGTI